MSDLLVLTGAALTVATSGMAAIEIRERRRPGQYRRVELRFGREVPSDSVLAILDRLAGLPRFACLRLDVIASRDGIRHYLAGDQGTLDSVQAALRAHLPGAELLVDTDEPPTAALVTAGGVIHLRGRLHTIRSDAPELASSSLLAALQPLGKGEVIALSWLVRPAQAMTVPGTKSGQLVEPEERKRLRAKNQGNVLLASGTLSVSAVNRGRSNHLLGRVVAVLRSRSTAYGRLQCEPRPRFWLRALESRRSFVIGGRYAVAELAGLLGWPLEAPALPGLRLGTSPKRIASGEIPTRGRRLGVSTWPGDARPLAQPLLGGLSHSLVIGPTGVGKSTLITNLICQDMAAGRGLVLIDGKGDAARDVLARLPKRRQKDVVVLDCGVDGPQPGLQLFQSGNPELAADVVLGVLSDLYRQEWGPLSERYLRAGLMAVARDERGTLADVPYVFSDAGYRRKLAGRVSDPLSRLTLASFDAMSPAERQQQLAAPLGKLGRLLSRPVIRTVLGQPEPKLDFDDILRHGRIVVISLAPLAVGAAAARLVGALSVFALFQAVQRRSALPEAARKPFLVYLDEPRALGDLPMPLDALLEQARGLGVGLTLAPQSMSQLPKPVAQAALTNVATRVVFRQDADDARLLARDLPGVSADDLGELGQYEAIARIGLGPGRLAAPASLRTTRLEPGTTDAAALSRRARERFGVSLENVDAGLEQRHQAAANEPVGRKRRQV